MLRPGRHHPRDRRRRRPDRHRRWRLGSAVLVARTSSTVWAVLTCFAVGDNPLVIRPPQQLPTDPEWPVLDPCAAVMGTVRIDGGLGSDGVKGGSGDDWVSVRSSQPWPVAENPAGQLAVGGAGEDVLRADGGRAFCLHGRYGDDRVLGGRFADGLVDVPGTTWWSVTAPRRPSWSWRRGRPLRLPRRRPPPRWRRAGREASAARLLSSCERARAAAGPTRTLCERRL